MRRFTGGSVNAPSHPYDRSVPKRCESVPGHVRSHFRSCTAPQPHLHPSLGSTCSASAQHPIRVSVSGPSPSVARRANNLSATAPHRYVSPPTKPKAGDITPIQRGFRMDFKPAGRLHPSRLHIPAGSVPVQAFSREISRSRSSHSVSEGRRVVTQREPLMEQTDGRNVSAPSRPPKNISSPQNRPSIVAPTMESRQFLEAVSVCEPKQKALKNLFEFYAHDRGGKKVMDLPQFFAFLDTYSLCDSAIRVGPFFHAFDRRRTGEYLTVEDFVTGCVAADVSTQHSSGSAGKIRWKYVLDFYDINYSGKLEVEEFKTLLADAKLLTEENSFSDFCRSAELSVPTSDVDLDYLLSLASSNRITGHLLFRFNTDFLSTLAPSGDKFIRRDAVADFKESANFDGDSDTNATTCATNDMADRALSGYWSSSEDLMLNEALEYESCEAMLMHECQQWRWWCPELTQLAALPAPNTSWKNYTRTPAPVKPPKYTRETQNPLESAKHVVTALLESGDIDNDLFTTLPSEEILSLCECVCQKLQNEPNVIEKRITSSVKIFGSLHGQLSDLLSYFHYYNKPFAQLSRGDLAYTHYVFMGDFVDFGSKSLEVVLLLFSLYLLHPNHITLLRGVHEASHVNYTYGFYEECMQRTNCESVYAAICNAFEYLSLAAIFRPPTPLGVKRYGSNAAKGILCMPTGLPSKLKTLKALDGFKKPNRLEMKNTKSANEHWLEVSREMFAFPPRSPVPSKDLKRFCDENDVRTIIQSRFCPRHGVFVREHGRNIVLSSAVAHAGAFLHLRRDETSSESQTASRGLSVGAPNLARETSDPTFTTPRTIAREVSGNAVQARIRALENAKQQSHATPDIKKPEPPRATYRLHPQSLVAHPVSPSMQDLMRIGPLTIEPRTDNAMWIEHSKKESVVLSGQTLFVLESKDDPAPALPLSTLKQAQSLGVRDCVVVSSAMTSPSPCRVSPKDDKEKTPCSNSNTTAPRISTHPMDSIPAPVKKQPVSKKDLFGIQILQEAREMSILSLHQLKDPNNAKWLYSQWREAMSSTAYLNALLVFTKIAKKSLPSKDIGLRHGTYVDKTSLALWLLQDYKIPVTHSSRWFNAFDFNQDGKVCASDFLFGLLASSRKNSCAIMRAIALMRYYSSDADIARSRKQQDDALPTLEMREFLEFTSDCKARCKEVYPVFRFPIDLEAFTSLTINTEKILSIKWE